MTIVCLARRTGLVLLAMVMSLVGDLNTLKYLLERPLAQGGSVAYSEELESQATVGNFHRLDDNEEYED